MRRGPAIASLGAVVAALLAAFALLGRSGRTHPVSHWSPGTRPNVILLTVDTLRPDHLGVYGYPHATSPNLDRFASQSVVFEQAVSSSAWTSPGLVSLLTGLFAVRHGVTGPAASVAAGTPTLATILSEAGFQVPNLVYLTSIPNYTNLGFGPPLKEFFDETAGSDELLRWLDHDPDQPFFLWYHYRYIHLPYQPRPADLQAVWPGGPAPDVPESPGLTAVRNDVIVPRGSVGFSLPSDRDAVTRLYDGEIRRMDEWLGSMLARLEHGRLLDHSLIVLSADHGEELFEHGWVGHASTTLQGSLHEELVRIPLIVRFPGAERGGQRIAEQVRGVDVLPTVVDALGLDTPENLDGRSLLPLIRREPDPSRPAILETAIAGYQTPGDREGERLAGIRDEGWKLVLQCGRTTASLFHTEIDPGETKDLAGTGDPRELELRTELTRYLARYDPGFLTGQCSHDAPHTVPPPADAPCPEIEEPRDGSTIAFDAKAGIVHARWKGRPELRYRLEYELGEGRFHTVGQMAVTGNSQDFGPFPRSVWESFHDFNPWRVRVVLPGRDDCRAAEVRFRF